MTIEVAGQTAHVAIFPDGASVAEQSSAVVLQTPHGIDIAGQTAHAAIMIGDRITVSGQSIAIAYFSDGSVIGRRISSIFN